MVFFGDVFVVIFNQIKVEIEQNPWKAQMIKQLKLDEVKKEKKNVYLRSFKSDNSNKLPLRKTRGNSDQKGFCDIFGRTFLATHLDVRCMK